MSSRYGRFRRADTPPDGGHRRPARARSKGWNLGPRGSLVECRIPRAIPVRRRTDVVSGTPTGRSRFRGPPHDARARHRDCVCEKTLGRSSPGSWPASQTGGTLPVAVPPRPGGAERRTNRGQEIVFEFEESVPVCVFGRISTSVNGAKRRPSRTVPHQRARRSPGPCAGGGARPTVTVLPRGS